MKSLQGQVPNFGDCMKAIRMNNQRVEETKKEIKQSLNSWIKKHWWEGDKAYDDR